MNIKWKNTFQTRFNSLVKRVENNSYLSDYPALKSSLGFTLVRIKSKQFIVFIILIVVHLGYLMAY